MRILIAAGGSGGHIFPAIALARRLRRERDDADVLFVGSDKALDRRIFKKEAFRFSLLSANKLPYRPRAAGAIVFSMMLAYDIIKSFFVIAVYRPDVVVTFGGYVSAAVTIASVLCGSRRIAHEQNVIPGRANMVAFRMADAIAISFEETRRYLGGCGRKVVVTGNPIRDEMLKKDRGSSLKALGLEREKFTILIIGGSQGAHFLNETCVKALTGLGEDTKSSLQIVHITGLKDYEWVMAEYKRSGPASRVYSFVDRIEEAYGAADLVITRSGASAVFEISSFGKPMILIPYPYAMSHQAENARVFSKGGAAIEIAEHDLSADRLKEMVAALMDDRSRLALMGECSRGMSAPDASGKLAQLVLDSANR